MLAFSELGVSASTLPTVLGIFLFGANKIFEACLLQMFSMHSFSIMESGLLDFMESMKPRLHGVCGSLCRRLQPTSLLCHPALPHMAGTCVAIGLRSLLLICPLPFLRKRLPFCGHNVLSHSYCLHSDLIQLRCADTRPNSIPGLCVVVSTTGLGSLLIVASYVLILCSVLNKLWGGAEESSQHLCSHMCAVLVYYVPMIGLALVHRFMKHAALAARLLLANVYLLVPPMLSPIIYSAKNKQIRQGLLQLFLQRKC